jgi:hypothetical protein
MAGDDELWDARGDDQIDQEVRDAIYASFAAGRAPRRSFVARTVRLPLHRVRASCERLAEAHTLVLHPDSREVLMAMPFSAVPTPFRVQGTSVDWWAPCAWDAFGIAAATGDDVRITTTCPDCQAPLTTGVTRGRLAGTADAVAHFVVPARYWWDDIGFT